jgi:hypothetical protein
VTAMRHSTAFALDANGLGPVDRAGGAPHPPLVAPRRQPAPERRLLLSDMATNAGGRKFSGIDSVGVLVVRCKVSVTEEAVLVAVQDDAVRLLEMPEAGPRFVDKRLDVVAVVAACRFALRRSG